MFAQGSYRPCRQCDPCRINRKREWTNRIRLEAGEHGSNSFWTLSYSDENLPLTMNGSPTLAPEDTRNWLKRIRKAVGKIRLRYYYVGEYGDLTFRPHYHVALFGYERCARGVTLRERGRPIAYRCCECCQLVQSTWKHGDVDGGGLEEGSARYLVGYVLKKMTRYDDPRLGDRNPEFARMSLKPGIGMTAMFDIASVMMQLGLDESEADVPSALRRGNTIAPLGRYLKNQLRLMVGKEVLSKDAQIQIAMEKTERMLALYEAKGLGKTPFKSEIIEAFTQDVLNRQKRYEIFGKKRGVL